jgi:hypothetical protein
MGFIVKHLRWVFHNLNETQLIVRIQILNKHMRIVRPVQHQVNSLSWPLMSCDFISQQITTLSGCRRTNHPRKWQSKWYKRERWWSQSHGIFSIFTLSKFFQEHRHLVRTIKSNIFCSQFLSFVHNLAAISYCLWKQCQTAYRLEVLNVLRV